MQRRDLTAANQSTSKHHEFHKSPTLFIFTCPKPTPFWSEQWNTTQLWSKPLDRVAKDFLKWLGVAGKSESYSANFRRHYTNLVNFTDKYFCQRINNEKISTMAVRHVFCMNEKLTKRRPFQVLGTEKAICVWKVLMAFAIVCEVFF